ncbi:MAG: Xaa-Pro aminopeptidase [Ferrovum sp.]|nr:Xaa-Pro aminopeptidase [Ferrovum sp.]NDU88205.1 Xaa-Pro aminopeptidase [Ferrovum sp.]
MATLTPLKTLRARRRCLAEFLGHGVAVIPTAREQLRNADTHYPYRWDSHFHYLTEFPEPEAVLVLVGGKKPRSLLFCRPLDGERERWEGRRFGPDRAREAFGVDEAYPINTLDEKLPPLLAGCETVYSLMGQDDAWDRRVQSWLQTLRAQVRSGVAVPQNWGDLRDHLGEMRLIKDERELQLMRRAADISVRAHRRAMKATRPGRFEYAIEAELLHEFRVHGAAGPAYPSIVAGGGNACILHYVDNQARLRAGDLLLIDAACEWQGYAADITRTYPVSGKFSPAQRDLYEVVLAAQQAALAQIKPGKRVSAYHDAAVQVLAQGLIDLNLCQGTLEGVVESGAYRRFYMHRTGHWLGRDVHDVGRYVDGEGRPRRLQKGMVLTVEPGLYVGAEDDIPEPFRNLGIRIEDDVVVTEKGHEVLTEAVPKTVEDIEVWMTQTRRRS